MLTIGEITHIPPTLNGWWVFLFASIVNCGSVAEAYMEFKKIDGGCTAFAITVGAIGKNQRHCSSQEQQINITKMNNQDKVKVLVLVKTQRKTTKMKMQFENTEMRIYVVCMLDDLCASINSG
eukprot:11601410-Ditylum_brightwellii.AAC.1